MLLDPAKTGLSSPRRATDLDPPPKPAEQDAVLSLLVNPPNGLDDPRGERAIVRWLGRLFLEKPLAFALAARCVELVRELRGREAGALEALVRG